jgi:hypothetical protein
MRTFRAARVVTLVALAAGAAQAGAQQLQQYPGLTASFVQPTGTVSSTASIPVLVRLSLAPGSQALQFDGSSPGTSFGLPPGLLPTTGFGSGGFAPFASYTSATTNASRTCTGTFTGTSGDACGAGAYAFTFNLDPATSFSFRSSFTLLPGQTFDFLFGTFTPVGGMATAGTYIFYGANPFISVTGLGANGNVISGEARLASTCSPAAASCAFTRTVVAADTIVPEPGTVALVAAGLLGLAGVARRRRVPPGRARDACTEWGGSRSYGGLTVPDC